MELIYKMFEQLRTVPGMYLGKKSISRLYVFITGYVYAQFEFNDRYQTSFFDEFTSFVRKNHNNSGSKSWITLILEAASGDEEKAVDIFYELLDEFLIEQNQMQETEE